jgi:hypothetical protein
MWSGQNMNETRDGEVNKSTITICGPVCTGKTTLAFAIKSMLKQRFNIDAPVVGDTSGVSEDNPVAWQVDMVQRQHWEIVEEMPRPAEAGLAVEVERLRFREEQLLSSLGVIAHFPAEKSKDGEARTHEEWLVDKAKRAIETNDELKAATLAQQKQEG